MTIYKGKLTRNSSLFNRLYPSSSGQFYYNEIEMSSTENGLYKFSSVSTFDIYGYLYSSSFNSTNFNSNLLISDDDNGYGNEFYFEYYLQSNLKKYILVITSHPTFSTGSYSIYIRGPNTIQFY